MDNLMLFLHFLESEMYQKINPANPPVKEASRQMILMGVDPIDLANLLRGFASDLLRSADETESDYKARRDG
jgi:hypothetical protein